MNCHQKPILYVTLDLLSYTYGFFDCVHALNRFLPVKIYLMSNYDSCGLVASLLYAA